ncbi:MAG: GNAT family N-acetyltransferase [Actinomycetota bacterium]
MSAVIRLEPFADEHLDAFARTLEDPAILRFTRMPVPPPPGFASMWFERYEQGRRDGTREVFAIVDDADGSYLGVAVVPTINRETRTAELGYVVAPWARGRGVATEALRQLTKWALETLDPMRLELWISPDNPASKKVAEKCGYVYEGTLRMMHFKQDLWEDGEIWSRIATDPDPG